MKLTTKLYHNGYPSVNDFLEGDGIIEVMYVGRRGRFDRHI